MNQPEPSIEELVAIAETSNAHDLWREVVNHPCSHHALDRGKILEGMAERLRFSSPLRAVAVMQEADRAGLDREPDYRFFVAECLNDAGRMEDGLEVADDALDGRRDDELAQKAYADSIIRSSFDDYEMGRDMYRAALKLAIEHGDPHRIAGELFEYVSELFEDPPVGADAELARDLREMELAPKYVRAPKAPRSVVVFRKCKGCGLEWSG